MGEVRHALVQRQARALGDPTRHEIYRLIEASTEGQEEYDGRTLRAGGLTVRELADALSLHGSAVRQHLAKLVDAQLVVAETLPADGPGRPRSIYRRTPAVVGAWGVLNPYERLSALLLDIVITGLSPRETGRRAGRELRASPEVADVAPDPLALLSHVMEVQGFAPRIESDGRTVDVVLGHCPIAAMALIEPDVVCQAHRGIAEGLVGVGAVPATAELLDIDPVAAGCRLRFDSELPQNSLTEAEQRRSGS